MSNDSNIFFNILSNINFFIDLNHCESILWKLNSHKVMEHALISSGKRMSVKKMLKSECC